MLNKTNYIVSESIAVRKKNCLGIHFIENIMDSTPESFDVKSIY